MKVLWPLLQSSFNNSNNFYLNQAIYKHRRQVKLRENFDNLKSSSYYKQLQDESCIIYNSNR